MRCRRVRSLLTELIDGALNEDIRRHLEAHLEACNKCKDEFRGLLSVHEAMQAAYKFKASPGFAARVIEKLPAGGITGDTFAGTGLLFRFRGAGSKSLKLAEAAAIVLAIVTGIVFGNFLSDKLFTGRDTVMADTGTDYLSSLNSLDYLHPAPPESIAGLYLAIKEGGDER